MRAEALACAAEGQFERADALAERIEAQEPGDPRNALLRAYLREERATEALLAAAEDKMAAGNLRGARAAAAEALTLDPWRPRARTLLSALDRALASARAAARWSDRR